MGAMLPAGGAGAQAGEPEGFVPGEATAIATTMTMALSPGGGKPIEVSLGKALARYQNRTANSEGAALSLGLLQIFFGPSSQCGDRPPIIPADQLPPVSIGDSRRQGMATPLEVRSPGTPETGLGGVLGTQMANAQATPQTSTAATSTVSQDYGLIALDNGHTEVGTQLVDGVRQATAVATGSQLRILGGMVIINNPRWEAVARTGATETSEGRFTFTSASIMGFATPPDRLGSDFAGFAQGLADFLSGLGIRLDYPKVTVDNGTVTVSPLSLGIANPPLGTSFIGPLLDALAPYKEEETRRAIAVDCNNQAVIQILDLVFGILSGSGSVALNVGGVSAFTAATVFPDPPALDLGLSLEPLPEPAPLQIAPVVPSPTVLGQSVGTRSSSSSSSSSFSSSVADIPTVDALPPPLPAVEVAVDVGPATAVEKSTEPVFELPDATLVSRKFIPGKKGGTAAWVGGFGLAGLLLLAAADRFVMKRTKREIAD